MPKLHDRPNEHLPSDRVRLERLFQKVCVGVGRLHPKLVLLDVLIVQLGQMLQDFRYPRICLGLQGKDHRHPPNVLRPPSFERDLLRLRCRLYSRTHGDMQVFLHGVQNFLLDDALPRIMRAIGTSMAQLICPRELRVRIAASRADINRFEEFMYKNPDEKLPVPSREDLEHALSDGGLYLVEDAETSELLACSGVFLEYIDEEKLSRKKSRETLVFECAGTRALPEINGLKPHSIQQVLFWLRTTRIIMDQGNVVDPECFEQRMCFLVAIRNDNGRSIRGTEAAGFCRCAQQEWLRPHEAWAQGNAVLYYTLPPDALATHARRFLDLMQAEGEVYRVDQIDPTRKEWFKLLIDKDRLRLEIEALKEIAKGKYNHLICELPARADPYYPHNDQW